MEIASVIYFNIIMIGLASKSKYVMPFCFVHGKINNAFLS